MATLSLEDARRLVLACQGLEGGWRLPKGKEGAAQAVERLGFVQIDTIAVIERAHHHTLWVRRPDYRPAMLEELLAKDRRVFEYWAAPAAAYVPMCDYRWLLPRMLRERQARRQVGWQRDWLKEHQGLMRQVLERIRREGPLGSSDFHLAAERKRGPWWDWTPAKRALEVLFNTGELMVTSRRNFERRYDLAERVLPAGLDTRVPDAEEVRRFGIRRYLAAQGLAAARDIRWGGARRCHRETLHELVAAGEVLPVAIEGWAGEPHYALAEALRRWARRRRGGAELHVLSPFDSLTGDRQRLARLFGFDYRIECYVPQAKRKHGYFCLPVVWDGRFVGRLDPKADRQTGTFVVRQLTLEPGVDAGDGLLPALADKLRAFARFNGCPAVRVESTWPRGVAGALRRELKRQGG